MTACPQDVIKNYLFAFFANAWALLCLFGFVLWQLLAVYTLLYSPKQVLEALFLWQQFPGFLFVELVFLIVPLSLFLLKELLVLPQVLNKKIFLFPTLQNLLLPLVAAFWGAHLFYWGQAVQQGLMGHQVYQMVLALHANVFLMSAYWVGFAALIAYLYLLGRSFFTEHAFVSRWDQGSLLRNLWLGGNALLFGLGVIAFVNQWSVL
ncbi:MAG: hypothetical protein H7A33_00735 [Deltaproteobacteria bacterium]|nr:hypothetical protein [Deltaproteobacteria bacterium]